MRDPAAYRVQICGEAEANVTKSKLKLITKLEPVAELEGLR